MLFKQSGCFLTHEDYGYMNIQDSDSLLIWVFQTGEPLHIDGENARPMRAMNLSNMLVQAGHRVVLWSAAFFHQEKRHRSSTAQCIRISDNLEIRLIPSMGYQRHIGVGRLIDHAGLAVNLKKMLRQTAHLPDVAFIGYPPIEAAAVLTRWLAIRGVPSLLDAKDQWPTLFLDAMPAFLQPFGRVALWPYFYLARRAMRDATGLSAMANSFLDWALGIAERGRTENDGVFPLTSPIGQVSDKQLAIAKQWWDHRGIRDDGRPRISFVGSHMSIFDFKPVQEAAKLLEKGSSTCEFIICGDGGSSDELKKMMAGLPNVHFPGWVDRPKIEALAVRCIGAIAPIQNIESFQKSIPNKIIDALSLGLPILCPLQGEVAALIAEHGVGMRYGTDTGKSLHDCILALMQDTSLQQSMSVNARVLYKERFSFEMVYGGLVRHLERLAKKPGGKLMERQAFQQDWYRRYYMKVGQNRNSLRLNPGVLFQTLAMEASVVRALGSRDHDPQTAHVLDVGCGGGGDIYQLLRVGYAPALITGIEIQAERLDGAKKLYPHIRWMDGDATQMAFETGSYDLVFESTMFATLPDDLVRSAIASEMVRVCRPGGYLVLVDWRTPKPGDSNYKALAQRELRKLFAIGRDTALAGVFKGALVPPVGRFLSKYASWLYFPVAKLFPFLVGQVVYVLKKF
jgi:SAM-dependent methyltransferase/glycosyltransferase involved in cell wall biosynthesis